ncbi:MAG: hypothetical protein ACK559_13885, partial [bacterium]
MAPEPDIRVRRTPDRAAVTERASPMAGARVTAGAWRSLRRAASQSSTEAAPQSAGGAGRSA